jgi:trimeric autotransporter adhesin
LRFQIAGTFFKWLVYFYLERMMKSRKLSGVNLVSAGLVASAVLVACGGSSSSTNSTKASQATLVVSPAASNVTLSGTTTLSTTGGSGTGAVTYAVSSGSCTVSSTTLTAPATAGTCSVTATKAADSSYSAATSAAITINVTSPVIVARDQDGATHSYDAATNKALPGNHTIGEYSWGLATRWWGGTGTDSVYVGYGVATGETAGMGVFVETTIAAPWSISQMNSLTVGLGTNVACVGICKATIVLNNATDTNCKATSATPFTILTEKVNTGNDKTSVGGSVPTYTKALTDANWTVTGCTTNTMTAFKALSIRQVHAQLLRPDMQTETADIGTGFFANGVNLGGIKFQ